VQSPPPDQERAAPRTGLPTSRLAPSRARAFVRAVIGERALATGSAGRAADRLADDAALLVSELVTNALVHAGTRIDVSCAPERAPDERGGGLAAVTVEVVDRQPHGQVPARADSRRDGRGLGLRLVAALAESWGVTYRRTEKGVWCRLVAGGTVAEPAPAPPAAAVATRTAAFLAEAGELLAGQLDEDLVAALMGQLLVPRLADWCAVWLATEDHGMRLSRVWHTDERRTVALRAALEGDPPPPTLRTAGIPWPWPEGADGDRTGGSALAFSLVAGGTCLGMLVIGRSGPPEITDAAAATVEDTARRAAQAVLLARQYTRQTTISRALQRRQLPPALAPIPGVESAVVYEPHGRGQTVGGDFYDLFAMGNGRWCFLLGDVQGKDPEAMAVTGLTRHLVRLLAREGHGVESVLSRLNTAMAEEGAEAVALGGENARPRFLSLVYGELEPHGRAGGATCTLASGGHPPPLWLRAGGEVRPASGSHLLLGIDEDARFAADSFTLAPGDTLLCVTDGVTERRDGGGRQLDDGDGLAGILRGCRGLGAMAVAERVRQATHDFGPGPVEDDLAVLVLHAREE
jgi:GAF domain-containing protein